MKKILNIFLILLTTNLLFAQTILNTEKLMSKIDSTFVFGIGLDGNMERGNIELTENKFTESLREIGERTPAAGGASLESLSILFF